MRKTPALLIVAALGALALTGCAPTTGEAGSCDRTDGETSSLLDVVQVSGDEGAQPTVDMYAPYDVKKTQYADAVVGDGDVVTSSDQTGVMDMTLYDGETGDPIISTAYSGDMSQVVSISGWDATIAGFGDALQCATGGSRIVAAFPEEAVSDDVRSQYASVGFPEEGSIVVVVDLYTVYPQRASGTLTYNDGFGLPSVVRAPSGQPGVIVPDGDAPDGIVTQTLITGDGDELADGDTALIQYTGIDWDTKTEIASSWTSGSPAPLTLDPSAAKVFSEALIGLPIGSQVMIVVPADDADDALTQLGASEDAASIWVLDVLGTVDMSAASQ